MPSNFSWHNSERASVHKCSRSLHPKKGDFCFCVSFSNEFSLGRWQTIWGRTLKSHEFIHNRLIIGKWKCKSLFDIFAIYTKWIPATSKQLTAHMQTNKWQLFLCRFLWIVHVFLAQLRLRGELANIKHGPASPNCENLKLDVWAWPLCLIRNITSS